MAVNKNFVVKNGLEVNENLILADATNKNVGIGSTIPTYTLDVSGGIGATDLYISGYTTAIGDFRVGTSGTVISGILTSGYTGFGTITPAYLVDIRGPGAGTTSLYVKGDTTVSGVVTTSDLYVDNGLYVTGVSTLAGFTTFTNNTFVAGVSTFVGVGTFHDNLWVAGNLYVTGDISYDEVTGRNIYISGLSTFVGAIDANGSLDVDGHTELDDVNVAGASTFTGVGTFSSDLYVGGNLNVTGDLVYDEVTGRNINITGLSTFEGLSYFGSNVGVGTTNPAIAADSNNTNILNAGIVTANYIYGDISGATGVTTSITAAIGVSSEGTFVGSAATIINFVSSNGTAWDIQNSGAGIATATVTPGASIGLVIALGA